MTKLLNLGYWKTATPQSVQEEIDNGADVNARDGDGSTPLMKAVTGGENTKGFKPLNIDK